MASEAEIFAALGGALAVSFEKQQCRDVEEQTVTGEWKMRSGYGRFSRCTGGKNVARLQSIDLQLGSLIAKTQRTVQQRQMPGW
jgi:hypothetical protein